MEYRGVIIEESLENKDILKDVKILETKVEKVVEEHKTPWIKQWTLHTVAIGVVSVAWKKTSSPTAIKDTRKAKLILYGNGFIKVKY